MSERYGIKVEWDGTQTLLSNVYGSAEAAHLAIRAMDIEGQTVTVHKLGPAIEPQEPREWVVVRTNIDGEEFVPASRSMLYTRSMAKEIADDMRGARIMRVVEDEA